MRIIITALLAATVLTGSLPTAHAEGTTSCSATVNEKHLSGAAKTSFVRKCQTVAQEKCDSTASSRKLAGAAKTSFTKKCVSDAVGA